MNGARLIVSSRYLKGGTKKGNVKRRNYTKYIATRETVELREQNRQMLVGYMATRPGAEQRGAHGLFNGEDEPIVLNRVAEEIAHHSGNVWSHVVSLRREDAVRLGYENSDRWRSLVMRHATDIAAAHRIPLSHLKWYAAFHNTAHHPHIHLLVYSTEPGDGFLTEKGIEQIKSVLANDIFHDDLQSIYREQTASRDKIRALSAEEFSEMVRRMQNEKVQNPELVLLVRKLQGQLRRAKGKKVYGYLPKIIKQTVDEIFQLLAGDERIKSLYDEWCELEKLKYQSYTMQEPELPEMQDNKAFKSVKNMIIRTVLHADTRLDVPEPEPFPSANQQVRTAMRLLNGEDIDEGVKRLTVLANAGHRDAAYQLGRIYAEGDLVYEDLQRAEKYLSQAAEDGNSHAQYALAKLYLRPECRDMARAVALLKMSAEQNPWAAFRLGKLLLFGGEGIEPDKDTAMEYLTHAAEGGIEIAGQIVKDAEQFRNEMAVDTALTLFANLTRVLDEDYDKTTRKLCRTDSKLQAILRRKKAELGIKEEHTQGQSY